MAELNAPLNCPVLGVAMLDTQFPRPPGDIGNAASMDFPVLYHRVAGASVARAVTDGDHDHDLISAFQQAGRALRGRGATIIATSCGFLAPLQQAMAAATGLPVVTSALVGLPGLRQRVGPDMPIGILTFDARKLGRQHLPARFGPYRIRGIENGRELYPVISGNRRKLNMADARADVANAVADMLAHPPLPAAILLECTNLPPYRDTVSKLFGGPVLDIRDVIRARVANGTNS